MLTAKSQFFARNLLNTYNCTIDSTYFVISTAKSCFPVNLRYKSENVNKIWKFKNPRWRPPVTSFIWLLLPWKPIRNHVVTLNWKSKWSLLYVPNFKSIGWIVSKVEGGGDPIDPPPKTSCNYFFFEASGVKFCCLKWAFMEETSFYQFV